METDPAQFEHLDRRVERLEELYAHAERRHEELNAALLDLASRLKHVSERVGAIEATLRARNNPAPPEPAENDSNE